MTPSILERILKCPNLPSPPGVAIRILELTRDPNVTVTQIGSTVQADAALSAKILRTVNSSLFGLPQQVTRIDRALGLLGLSTVKSLVLGFSLVDGTRGVKDGGGLDLTQHWRRAIYSSAGARHIALVTRCCDPDEAFTAAVFQDIGVLAAAVALGDTYGAVLASAPASHEALPAHERAKLGLSHAEIGAALAQGWKLPPQYAEAVRYHHEPELAGETSRGLARAVYLGGVIAESMTSSSPVPHIARLMMFVNDWIPGGIGALDKLLERVSSGAQDLAKAFEKDLGAAPSIEGIMAEASERQIEAQIATQREAMSLMAKNHELAIAAVTDGLTRARNRKGFEAEIVRVFERSIATATPMAVLFADGDKFKSVNDRFGHPAGDAVLVEMARRLTASVGDRGTVCRYGGEEFVVIVPECDQAEAAAIAERARAAIESPPFDLSKVPGAPAQLPVTISVGVASSSASKGKAIPSPDVLVKAADDAVYTSKQNGRNRVTVAESLGAAPSATPSATPSGAPSAAAAPAATPARAPAPAPASPALSPALAAQSAAPGATGGKLRVLLVDDDALAGKLLQLAMQKRGNIEVLWAWKLSEASSLLAGLKPGSAVDFVVTDLNLGAESGLDVIRMVRAHALVGKVPVFLMSASEGHDAAAAAAGANAFVSKRELVTNINAWMQRVLDEYFPSRAAA